MTRVSPILFAACAALVLIGCETLSDNEGSTLTTAPDAQITEAMMLGKWDLDGERTNTANGSAGVGAIPDDIVKDIFGKGWRFEKGGVLKTDKTIGASDGKWRIEGTSELIVKEKEGVDERKFHISFRDGYMYLKNLAGRFMVMEKSKFFGF